MNRLLFLINAGLAVCLIISNLREPVDITTMETTRLTPTKSPFGNRGLQAAPGIQVNSLPAPFNLNGTMPYQVWVNGKRLPLNGEKADQIVEVLDLGEFVQPQDTAELHQGMGWITPLPIQ